MSNTELANFGLFVLSALIFGIGTAAFGGIVTRFDSDDMFIVSWIVGCIVFGIVMVVMH